LLTKPWQIPLGSMSFTR